LHLSAAAQNPLDISTLSRDEIILHPQYIASGGSNPSDGNATKPAKRWLKSVEIRKLLNISPGTLQTLRNNGKLPFSKIGGLIYYDAHEIDQILVSQKTRLSAQSTRKN
jgi:hypothetical protein